MKNRTFVILSWLLFAAVFMALSVWFLKIPVKTWPRPEDRQSRVTTRVPSDSSSSSASSSSSVVIPSALPLAGFSS